MNLFDDRWQVGGIARFAREVARRLPGFRNAGLRGHPAAPVEPLRLAIRLRRLRPDFFFSPGYNAPVSAPCPFAFTLHDLNHISVPGDGSAMKSLYYAVFIRRAIRRAAVVLTVSEFSRQQIAAWSGVDAGKVVNVGNGVTVTFRPEGPIFKSGGAPYFACMGSAYPHKNFRRIVGAFADPQVRSACRLVVVGPASAELARVVSDAGVAGLVDFTGAVDDAGLAAVYRGAVALVFPSLYEGFGLPIVEAMACGTAVITSATASMPEVAGEAALLVEPTSEAEIARAMRELLSNQALRAGLAARGLVRAAGYTWDATAERVLRALSPWTGGAA